MMGDIEEAGQALANARRNANALGELPGGFPSDEATAYEIQRHAISAYGGKRVGYKIGATNPAAQTLLGTDHPFRAPLFEADCYNNGVVVDEPGYGLIGLEPEFALRLGTDLPARSDPYTLDDVSAAVDMVHPAFEMIGLRLPHELFTKVLIVTADFGANVGFVAGEGSSDWRQHDLADVPVQVRVDGEDVANGSGANVLGHPLNALLWLANDLRQAGDHLSAGDWVSTGTCAGVVKIKAGQQAVANFGAFGEVGLTLKA
ncbi:MAG: fumarylacetoacetate hydrolase family protein [Pseudomonadota bacterium]